MSLLCRWRQRALEQAALSGSALPHDPALQQHLSGCASCRRYWNELRVLSAELAALSEPLPSGEGFAESAWARFCAARTSPKPPLRLAFVLTAAVAVILGLFLWNQVRYLASGERPNGNTGQVASTPPASVSPGEKEKAHARVAEGSQGKGVRPSTGLPHTKRSPSASKIALSSTQAWRKWAAITQPKRRLALRQKAGLRTYARRYRHQRHRVAFVPKRSTHPSSPQRRMMAPARPKWQQWSQWGDYYASQGDYERAATAYGSAYAERPDPQLALAAGQAAENAGDVTRALSYYTRILNQPSAKKPPEKGSSLWNHANDTV